MSYGHGPELAGVQRRQRDQAKAAQSQARARERGAALEEDAECRDIRARARPVLELPATRQALAARDITAVYRELTVGGVSQRDIALVTGQSQAEVSEILAGRRVKAYDLLVRIGAGLGVPGVDGAGLHRCVAARGCLPCRGGGRRQHGG